ncbi:MAG: hypothetical protein IPM38_18805 [Ignavibacteria bacterium]|nr:hypothetical protein [Ignavibacteria bacterium]
MNRSDKNLKYRSKTPKIQNSNLKSFFQSVLIPVNISADTPSGIKDQLNIFSIVSSFFKNHPDIKAGSDKSNSESVNDFADLHQADADMNLADANMHPADANMNFADANMHPADANMNFADANMNFADANMNFSDADMDPADANMNLANANMNFSDADMDLANANMNFADADMDPADADMDFSNADMYLSDSGIKNSDANIQFTENKFKGSSKQKKNAFEAVEKIFKKIQDSKKSKNKLSKRKKLSGLIKQSPAINAIVSDTDSYLHYSNLIIIEAGRDLPAVNLLSIKFFSGGELKLIIIIAVTYHNHKPAVYFAVLSETVSAFEGVIERYCGVPP